MTAATAGAERPLMPPIAVRADGPATACEAVDVVRNGDVSAAAVPAAVAVATDAVDDDDDNGEDWTLSAFMMPSEKNTMGSIRYDSF